MAFGRVQCPLAIPRGWSVVAAREDSSDGAEEPQDRGFVFHYAVTHDRGSF
jgi:hypothetical protein